MVKLIIGDIVLVKFPFTNLDSVKKRPALVLAHVDFSKEIRLFIIAMVTSKVEGRKLRADTLIRHWEQAGLLHPSLARLSKIVTVENEIIDKKLGRIHGDDREQIKKNLIGLFKLG